MAPKKWDMVFHSRNTLTVNTIEKIMERTPPNKAPLTAPANFLPDPDPNAPSPATMGTTKKAMLNILKTENNIYVSPNTSIDTVSKMTYITNVTINAANIGV